MKVKDIFNIHSHDKDLGDFLGEVGVVKDFPIEGVNFVDLTQILLDSKLFSRIVDEFVAKVVTNEIDCIVAIESRGFLIGSALSYITGIPLVLARKKGKLPRIVYGLEISKEYGSDYIGIQVTDIPPDSKVFIVDDLMATGGTLAMVSRICKRYCKAKFVMVMTIFQIPSLMKWQSDICEFVDALYALADLI